MKVYNLLSRKDNKEDYNFNFLPFISLFYGKEYCYLNIGWLNICLQFKIK